MAQNKAKKIYVIYTGGTIGMVKNADGYAPESGYLLQKIKTIRDFYHDTVPDFDIHEHDPLIDSANIQPKNWINIALDIVKNYQNYDGFVILHGTDTLAYTASALSFMLENLNKPVICTGSQIPICEIRSDAVDNILHSLILAASSEIAEVCIYFHKRLLRGNRTVKVDASGMDAFASPNYPPLASVGVDITLNEARLLPKGLSAEKVYCRSSTLPRIAMLSIFPGMDVRILRQLLNLPLQGLILKTYGSGNMMRDPEITHSLQEAAAEGVIIVNCSACLKGSVRMGAYESGSGLVKAGVLSGFDMTDEAALTKLFYLLSVSDYQHVDVKYALMQNLKGEVTVKRGAV